MIIRLNCPCGNSFTHEVDWEHTEEEISENREMGVERIHHCYVEIECPICGNTIRQVDVYEYPEGGFNYAEGHYEIQ